MADCRDRDIDLARDELLTFDAVIRNLIDVYPELEVVYGVSLIQVFLACFEFK